MKSNHAQLEKILFATAILLALTTRFLNLGKAPLTDVESFWALQALNAASPEGLNSQVVIGPQPAYIFLTALLFQLFGATNFLARFWPALIGTLLVAAPFILRSRLGRTAASVAVLGLALDPGLVTVSRQAGGPMLALGFGVLAVCLWLSRRPVLAAILAGLALLSGPAVFNGIVVLGISVLLYKAIKKRLLSDSAFPNMPDFQPELPASPANWRQAGLAFGLTFLVAGTFFLRFPQGLAAWMESLVVYLNGWISPSGVGGLRLIAALLVFQPLAVIFAILGIFRQLARPEFFDRQLRACFGITLILAAAAALHALIYPARQISDLDWVLVPVWVMAAWELQDYLPNRKSSLVSFLHAGLILTLSGLFYLTMVSSNLLTSGGAVSPMVAQLILLVGVFSLGALTSVLIALGWNPEISRMGVAWGILATGVIYLIGTLWSASQIRVNQPGELWGVLPGSGQAELFAATLDDFSKRSTGLANNLEIVSLVDTPSLRWILRDYPNARFTPVLSPNEQPPAIITGADQESPTWAATYRGQDFVWWTWPGWEGTLPDDFVNWIAFREAPTATGKIILWIRSDLFPGGAVIVE